MALSLSARTENNNNYSCLNSKSYVACKFLFVPENINNKSSHCMAEKKKLRLLIHLVPRRIGKTPILAPPPLFFSK